MKMFFFNQTSSIHSLTVTCSLLISIATIFSIGCKQPMQNAESSRPNVLLISVDDLNDWIGVLQGHPQARTPNIDRLASRGVLFTNAHAAAPACNPSRVALLTGLYPSSSGIYLNHQPWRPVLKNVITLPQYFKANGYRSLGAGKIFHWRYPDPESWDDYFPSKTKTVPDDPLPDIRPINGIPNTHNFDWGPINVKDTEMGDSKVADWVIHQLKKKHKRPFFLASGFYRPHLPWYAPKAYFDNYPIDSVQLPPIIANDLDDIPPAGIAIAKPDKAHKKIVEHNQWQKAVQGYLASIEFADFQVGRVIEALDQSIYKDNTIVVLFSDHGWHLGEKSHWRKSTLWERSTRVAFIVIAPSVTKPLRRSSQPVNLIDIFPTLIDLAGLPAKEELDGQSLRPLLESSTAKWSRPSLTTHKNGNHSIRDQRWHYIRYADGTEELYDHHSDKEEWNNLANNPEYEQVIRNLSKWLPKTDAPSAPIEIFDKKRDKK